MSKMYAPIDDYTLYINRSLEEAVYVLKAQHVLKSKDYKAAIKDLKKARKNTPENRMKVLSILVARLR